MVHVLPCQQFQRGIQADGAAESCGHIFTGQGQRGIHWSTTSHTSFVGAALRADVFYSMHPEVVGRRLFGRGVHDVAAQSAQVPPAQRSDAQAFELLTACLRGAGLANVQMEQKGPVSSDVEKPFARAEKLLQQAVELRPNASDLRYLLGSALHSLGQRSDAIIQ
eukprot:symbB.v1.2.010592.t2/scaffold686.1/size316167/11